MPMLREERNPRKQKNTIHLPFSGVVGFVGPGEAIRRRALIPLVLVAWRQLARGLAWL